MKKHISILLVLAMVLTLAPTALASEEAVVDEAEEIAIDETIDESAEEITGEPVEEAPAEGPAEEAPDDEPEPVVEEPAADGAVLSVSGSLNAYQFSDNAELKLTSDTTLTINADKTIKRIFGDYALTVTVESGKTLTVENTDGHAVDVSSFTMNGPGILVVKASRNGIYTNKDIVINGGKLTVDSVAECVYSRRGSVTMNCTADLRCSGGCAVLSRAGVITLGGSITAVTTDDDSPCILCGGIAGDAVYAGHIIFQEGTYDLTAENNAVDCDFGNIEISGKLKATSSEGMAIVSHKKSVFGSWKTGTITINGAQIEARGKTYGIHCGGNIIIMDSDINAYGNSYAIYAEKGFTIGARLAVLTPVGGKIDGDTAVSSSGTAAKTVRIALPAITGTYRITYPDDKPYVGDTLTVVLTDVPGTHRIQWQRSLGGEKYDDIPGATGNTYTIKPEDREYKLRVKVTADGYSGALYNGFLFVYSRPSLSGGVKTVSRVIYYGDVISCTLTGDAANIEASKLRYQWQTSPDKSVWTDVPGATGASWQTPSTGTATTFARVVVTADGYTGQLVSDYHAINVKSSTTTALEGSVTIRQTSGAETSFELGKVITGAYWNTAGIVSTAPSLRYQWQRSANNANWVDISGATGTTYTPANADEGYWLRLKVTSIYSAGELYSDAKQAAPEPPAPAEKPTLTFSSDGKSAKVTGDWSGLYARVALVLDNNGVSGLYITQATINDDGTILIPEFKVPGLKVKGVNVALVPTLADIQSTTPNVKATASKMLT